MTRSETSFIQTHQRLLWTWSLLNLVSSGPGLIWICSPLDLVYSGPGLLCIRSPLNLVSETMKSVLQVSRCSALRVKGGMSSLDQVSAAPALLWN